MTAIGLQGGVGLLSRRRRHWPMEEPIPTDVLELLRERVGSLEQLEALLLLHREATRAWSLDEVAERLSLPVDMLEAELAALVAAGLLAVEQRRWTYAPHDARSAEIVARLAVLYPVRRLEVLRLLSDLAMQRIRGSAARAFADSFVIGRRKKDG
ncbi:MAG TPA: hypothetical protein VG755_40940 [Nannocystaceae bacterium]|nr:hypothetical protein [Nannocystaceae bacterium]